MSSSLVFRAWGFVLGSEITDLTGDEAFDAGRELCSPTKKGHVGVLLLCSFLLISRMATGYTLDRLVVPNRQDRSNNRDN